MTETQRVANDFPIHPAALIFPAMTAEEFDGLKEDIATCGQRDPVVLYRGQLLDGRHRCRACSELGKEVRTTTWEGDDPVAYVVSVNKHRRHLTPGQWSMCAARAREAYDAQAKERMNVGKGRDGSGGRGHKLNPVVNLPQGLPDHGKSRDNVGKAFGVSGKSVDHATKVLKNAVPEVIKQGAEAV
jgi:hypothetical protein